MLGAQKIVGNCCTPILPWDDSHPASCICHYDMLCTSCTVQTPPATQFFVAVAVRGVVQDLCHTHVPPGKRGLLKIVQIILIGNVSALKGLDYEMVM